MERIISKTTDNDLYKLSMGQAVFHNYQETQAGFKFINRGRTQFPQGFDKKLKIQIEAMSELKLASSDKTKLKEKCPFLTEDYLDWFSDFSYNPGEVKITQDGGDLQLEIDGSWERTIYWEVPLMAIISELYFKETGQVPDSTWLTKLQEKVELLKNCGAKYADFGTRRRFSKDVHDQVVQVLKKCGGANFLGTSNVELALKYDLKPIGTFAHEWVMAHAGFFGVENANRWALEVWAREFSGKLSTALTDTYTTKSFLQDYDRDMAQVFKTLRQDSGSPEGWTDQVIYHIKNVLGFNPQDFTALYSDSLNPKRVVEIQEHAKQRINTLFGIGTNLTNDVGRKPLNMVIKMHYVARTSRDRQNPVVKLSDDPGKISGGNEIAQQTIKKLGLVYQAA